MWFTGETWQPSPVAPGTVEDGVGAALVVRAVRLAAGLGCWALVEGVFRDACCAGGGIAASRLFLILLQGLALGARRPLRLGFIGAPELTHDERALLQMVAAAQRGDTALLEASAAWLAGPASAASVARAARASPTSWR